MKKKILILLLLGLIGNAIAGDKLVVTSDGNCFWVTSVKQEGDILKYNAKDTGEEKTIALSGVHGVIPSVTRGAQYTPGEVQKYIDRIKKLETMHKRLYRQLHTMLQEWEALQKPNEELEGDIKRLEDEFGSSDKSTRTYKKTVLDLGMVMYKDMQGKYKPRLDNVLADLKAEYVKVNKARLEEQAATSGTMTFEAFIDHEQLTKDVAKEAGESDKTVIETMLAATRQKVFDAQSSEAYKVYIAKKSIDSYLAAAWILLGIKECVAATDEQKSGIDKRIESLVNMAKKSVSSFAIDEMGFPMSAQTQQLMNSLLSRCSTYKSERIDISEQVFVIPEKNPVGLSFGRTFSVPLRLVIQRAQPQDRKFGLVVTYPGSDPVTRELGLLSFKDGVATASFNENFSGLEDGAQLRPDENGQYYFYFYVAYEVPGEKGDSTWQPISKMCFWFIRP